MWLNWQVVIGDFGEVLLSDLLLGCYVQWKVEFLGDVLFVCGVELSYWQLNCCFEIIKLEVLLLGEIFVLVNFNVLSQVYELMSFNKDGIFMMLLFV